ncbi:MAG: hypothetical protein ACOX61_05500 [Brooklawnia sp.]
MNHSPLYWLVGAITAWFGPRDQRGLSQSTENAVLLVGAITVAGLVVALVGGYVARQLGVLE